MLAIDRKFGPHASLRRYFMTSETDQPGTIATPDGATIAYRHLPAKASGGRPGLLFCCGFHSDMGGNKATRLHDFAVRTGRQYTRFDYQGHGASSGAFREGTIGTWFSDALAVLDRVTDGPQVVVGSSMGGWMAMLLARARPDKVAGLLLIAPAPDFPQKLMLPSMPEEVRAVLYRDGVWDRPSEYADEDYPITLKLIEESQAHHLLDGDLLPFDGPVRIIHGAADESVPLDHVLRIPAAIRSADVVTEIVKGGDHRLSTETDLRRMEARVEDLISLTA